MPDTSSRRDVLRTTAAGAREVLDTVIFGDAESEAGHGLTAVLRRL